MALFDERILEKEKPMLKEKKTSNSFLFDEKELDKQIAHTKKKNPFSLLQLPRAEKEKKKEKLPEVKKSVADIIPIIDQTDSGLFQLKELQYLEWGRTNREYFLFLYGPTELAVKERKDQFMRDIQLAIPLLPVSDEKQINLLYKLYNQNAKLGNKQ